MAFYERRPRGPGSSNLSPIQFTGFSPGFVSLYGSFSCVFARPTCVMFQYGTASILTGAPCGNEFAVFVKCSRITAY